MKPLMRFLLLEQLVPHGKEGDGQPGAKEENEVGGQLVPEHGHGQRNKLNQGWRKNLLLMEKGKLSPGAGRPSPPLLIKMTNRYLYVAHPEQSLLIIHLATEVLNPLAALRDVVAIRESILLKINMK